MAKIVITVGTLGARFGLKPGDHRVTVEMGGADPDRHPAVFEHRIVKGPKLSWKRGGSALWSARVGQFYAVSGGPPSNFLAEMEQQLRGQQSGALAGFGWSR